MAKILRAGAARRDITPEVGTLLYGYNPHQVSTSVHDPLNVTAAAFSDTKETVLLLTVTVGDFQTALSNEIREKIGSDAYPLKLHDGRQNGHIPGTKEYKEYAEKLDKAGQFGPSRITIDVDSISELVSHYHGTGILLKTKDGRWREIERITIHPEIIGVAVNNLDGKEAQTTTFTIRYSKDGYHIAPDYPSRKGEKAKR